MNIDGLEIQLLIKLDDEHAISKMMDIEDNVAKVVLEQEDTLGIEGTFRYEICLNNYSPRVLEQNNIKIKKSLITGFDYVSTDYEMVNVKALDARLMQIENDGGIVNYDDTQVKADIQRNADDIATVNTKVGTNASKIADVEAKADTNESNINSLGQTVAVNTNSINANTNAIDSNAQAISDNASDIQANAQSIADLVMPEAYDDTTVKQDIQANTISINNLEESHNELSNNFNNLEIPEAYDDTDIRDEINSKIDKEEGKVLSTNDFNDTYKGKLDILHIKEFGPQNMIGIFNRDADSDDIESGIAFLDGMISMKGETQINVSTPTIQFHTLEDNSNPFSVAIDNFKKLNDDLVDSNTLDDYVQKEDGKGLSTNDFTTAEKDKLASLNPSGNDNPTGFFAMCKNNVAKPAGNAGWKIINPDVWNYKVWDSHDAFNLSTGCFTVPEDGIYELKDLLTAGNTSVNNGRIITAFVVNPSVSSGHISGHAFDGVFGRGTVPANNWGGFGGTFEYNLHTGDKVYMSVYISTGGQLGSAFDGYISFGARKIGNFK